MPRCCCGREPWFAVLLPRPRLAEPVGQEIGERAYSRWDQSPLRHDGIDTRIGDRVVREYHFQTTGAQVLTHVPGRMQRNPQSRQRRIPQ